MPPSPPARGVTGARGAALEGPAGTPPPSPTDRPRPERVGPGPSPDRPVPAAGRSPLRPARPDPHKLRASVAGRPRASWRSGRRQASVGCSPLDAPRAPCAEAGPSPLPRARDEPRARPLPSRGALARPRARLSGCRTRDGRSSPRRPSLDPGPVSGN